MKMNFFIEQIAICPPDPSAAIELLAAIGAANWAHDTVKAVGTVYEGNTTENVANLAFNYQLSPTADPFPKSLEFEVLHYVSGDNWMQRHQPSVSHLGMHCTESQLLEWKKFFHDRGYKIAQEVDTQSHTNPNIAGQRWYTYCIFNTRAVLGVDLKFIVRREHP